MLHARPGTRLRVPLIGAWRSKRQYATYRTVALAAGLPAQSGAPAAGAAASAQPTAAYVHLPFCKRKCRYCDFPVIAVGMAPPAEHTADNMRAYVDLLCQEIAASQRLNTGGPLRSVFFGGGTPSLISLPLLEQILQALDAAFGIQIGAEISIEADPGTFDASRLRSYMGLGVNRVSVGVQSFQEELLDLCGRAHDVRDAYRAIEAVYAAGVPNWSLDLMSGLPNLTPDLWQRSLAAAIDADPHHLSIYDLQVEEHTPFAKLYRPGQSPLPSDEVAAAMYCTASTMLRGAGYEHYELSNYAKPGHRCAHNLVYWEGGAFYGFGMGSASYLQGRRFSRPKRLNAYRRWVEDFAAASAAGRSLGAAGGSDRDGSSSSSSSSKQGSRGGQEEEVGGGTGGSEAEAWGVPGSHLPPEAPEDKLLDTVMLRLRLSDGLDLRGISGRSVDGEALSKVTLRALEPHVENGLVECLTQEAEQQAASSSSSSKSSSEGGRGRNGEDRLGSGSSSNNSAGGGGWGSGEGGEVVRVRLADPAGFVVSNDIISDVFVALEEAMGVAESEEE